MSLMEKAVCYFCGKVNLSKNEIGLSNKLLNTKSKFSYCFDCLAEYLDVSTDYLFEKVEQFKIQRCNFFDDL
jgi:hypothetical protein